MPQIRRDKVRSLKCRYCEFRIPVPKRVSGEEPWDIMLVAKSHIRAMHPSDQRSRLPLRSA